MNTKVNLAGVELKNPVMVASGTFGSGAEYSEFVDLNRLGAVVTKGVASVPWPGNPAPRIAETASGMLNAIGLQNPGIDLFSKRDLPFLEKFDTKVIVNVCGHSTEEYLDVVERLADEPRVDMLEINISCPNVKEGGIAFGQDPKAVEAITKAVKAKAKQLITNITAVPAAIVTIVKSAFTGSALAGGAMGTMIMAMQKGIQRGIFSNESGLGSAPIAAAAAQTKEPVRQGLVSMTGTFIDTIVICSMTGLSIVITGTWNTGLEGVAITTAAFQQGLPFPPIVASFSLMLCLVFFAFTTILGWDYYGERCLEYLLNRNQTAVKTYRWLYIICVFIGPYMTVAAVWNIADIFNALMAFPNLIALLALNGVVRNETKNYFKRHPEL